MKRLIVFDLDGTLINSLEDLADSANHVLEQHGFPIHPVDAYRYFVGDGVRKLIERILPAEERNDAQIEQCRKEFVEYYKIHTVLGHGNFVLAVSEGAFAGKPTSYYDLFRIENGKIAEHWDVMETIAPVSEWKHENGKFAGLK